MADQLTVYKFTDKDDASAFAQNLGRNGYRSVWTVLEYGGAADDTVSPKGTPVGMADSMRSTD